MCALQASLRMLMFILTPNFPLLSQLTDAVILSPTFDKFSFVNEAKGRRPFVGGQRIMDNRLPQLELTTEMFDWSVGQPSPAISQ